jgi:dTDP-4-dehydrorhamnose reductase
LEDGKNLTLRNSIVGPDIDSEGIGLLNWFMQQKGQVNGFIKAIWTGQTTLQLAKTMEAAAVQRAHGLYNMVPDSGISKYELLRLFNRYLRDDALTICPVEGVNADKSLKRTRFDFDWTIPDYPQMVEEMAAWMKEHAWLYPHYGL